jgi:signal transduction histidine kinase
VLLNTQLLKMSHEAGEPVDPETLDMIKENAVAAGDLVAKLLDFAKVGAQERNIVEHVSMSALINQVARRFLPVAEQKGLYVRTCEADDGAADARVLTDRLKLERILSNLVDNAIKYTSRGGVTLELVSQDGAGRAAGDVSADAGAAGARGGVVVRIRDTGIGIPQDKVPYLFDEFYQVHNYERDRSKGFGMGLAICRSLARHVGADVRLADTGAQGSCFEILLGAGAGVDVIAGPDDGATVGANGGGHPRPGVGADRGGRPGGAAGDREDPAAAGLCGV